MSHPSVTAAFVTAAAAFLGPDGARPPRPAARGAGGAPPLSFVVDRHGRKLRPQFDQITERLEALSADAAYGPPLAAIDAALLTQKIIPLFRSGMTTRELDLTAVALCAALSSHSADYQSLAARICVSDLHKRTPASLLAMMQQLRAAAPERFRVSAEMMGILERFGAEVDARLRPERDYAFRHFGWSTLACSYLQRSGDKVLESTLADAGLMERPGHLYMRVALGLHVARPGGLGHQAPEAEARPRLEAAFRHYDYLSTHGLSNATPTLLNAATEVPQLSSCFLLATGDDLDALLDSAKGLGQVSKWSGGASIWLSNVRSEGSLIRKTGGRSSGIKRYVRILNELQMYVDQGGNRPGAFAIYLHDWHDDVLTFLDLPRHKGVVLNAPDLKYGLMLSRRFVRALREDGPWYTMCPDECPGLYTVWGAAFEARYDAYVAAGRYRRRHRARDLLAKIHETQRLRGVPYLVSADRVNSLNNLQNVATVCSSNLCAEVTLPSFSGFDAEKFGAPPGQGETGVCNLGAVCYESFLEEDRASGEARPDYAAVVRAAAAAAEALDNIIDLNRTPTAEGLRSNLRHRPIGVGVMGLADVFARMQLIFGEPRARAVDRALAAAVYYGAMRRSVEMGRERGSYASFAGSPASRGHLQPDLWAQQGLLEAGWEAELAETTGGAIRPADWEALRAGLRAGHLRNCFVTAFMPTASTSNIVGQNECFEPFTSNMYTRSTQAGEFIIVNRHMMRELTQLGLWTDAVRREILAAGGSVQGLAGVTEHFKRRFRTAREMDQRLLTLHAKARAPFVDQSMSLNYYFSAPTLTDLATLISMSDELGLKTISYYIHSQPAGGTAKTSAKLLPGPEDGAGEPESAGEAAPAGQKSGDAAAAPRGGALPAAPDVAPTCGSSCNL